MAYCTLYCSVSYRIVPKVQVANIQYIPAGSGTDLYTVNLKGRISALWSCRQVSQQCSAAARKQNHGVIFLKTLPTRNFTGTASSPSTRHTSHVRSVHEVRRHTPSTSAPQPRVTQAHNLVCLGTLLLGELSSFFCLPLVLRLLR